MKIRFLNEMARVGWVPTNTTKTIEVYVRTDDEGKIPHFHVRKYGRNNDSEWDVPIKYESAEYFHHGYYTDIISTKVAKQLNAMLKENNPKDPGRTYWESAIVAWNSNNSDVELPITLEQPNYGTINE